MKALYAIPFVCLLAMLGYFTISPAEDAFILYRYAENLASGHGIVWNVGADPVEGATSFLWVVVLAITHLVGFSIPSAAQVIGFASAALIVSLLLVKHRTIEGVMLSVVFALSPVTIQYMSGFEAPLFSLLIVLWLYSHERGNYTTTAIISLLMGMLRPEGAILAVLLWAVDHKNWRKWSYDVGIYFVMLGLVYFIGRWMYFGYPLPNTFYVKSAGSLLHFGGADNYFPFYIVAFMFFYGARHNRFAYVLFLFPLLYLFIEQWQNIGWRFQYPILAGLLYLNRPKRTETAIFATVSIFLMFLSFQGKDTVTDERAEIGKRLSKYQGGWMVSSEAGWLPYFSKWHVIDPVGLNDEYIAHNGLTDEYLDRHNPALIMFHVYSSTWKHGWANGDENWENITQRLYQYAISRGYKLAAITNVKHDCRWWFVKNVPSQLVFDLCAIDYPYVQRGIQ